MQTDPLPACVDWVLDRIRRHIARHGYRMTQASGTLSDLYVSVAEARALLDGAPTSTMTAQLPGVAAIGEAPVLLPATLLADNEGPIGALRHRLGLGEVETKLLLAAVAPLVFVDVARLYTFTWADFAVKQPTVGFLAELVADDAGGALAAHAAFAPDAALGRYQLVRLTDAPSWGRHTPLLHRGVTVPDAVLAALRGQSRPLPEGLEPTPAPAPDTLLLPETTRRELWDATAQACAGAADGPRPLLVGPLGAGRRSAFAAALAEQGWGLMTLDLRAMPEDADAFAAGLGDSAREALLARCGLLLRGDEIFDDAARGETVALRLRDLLLRFDGPLAVTARSPVGTLHRHGAPLFEVPFVLPTAAEQRTVWGRALEALPCRFEPELPALLTRRFSVTPGTICRAVAEAYRQARLRRATDGPPTLTIDDMARAIRRRVEHALGAVAEPFATTLTWDDVVLPVEILDTLDEVVSQARNRERVYDEWGFRQKMSYGRGLSCLFSGPPGTGKTMMAAIVAQTLGRECYRVDLSRVVSKWVGETEKNLARVFDEAEKAQVILLFDEADSLFSSRTEVKGSNDRFANMEINYLLQRMEAYDGMSILTTNFEKGIDEAFKRRIKFRLHFPLPETEQRAELWQRMIPAQMAVSSDVSFDYLGKKFKLAGGSIKNAVLRAAFYAAETNGMLTHALLEKAALAESREMGRLI